MTDSKKRFHVDNQFIMNPRLYGQYYLLQLCDLACSADYEVPIHDHLGYEITYVLSGEGVFYRNSIPYNVSAGMIFLISKNDTHSLRSSRDNPLRFFCVSFSFNKADPRYSSYEEIERFFDSFDYPIAMDKNNISAGFVGALNEMANWGKMSEELMISHLSQIIIYTYRSFQSENCQRYFSSLHIDTTKKFIYEIINYIDSDLTEINKLQTLGDKLGYNYSYMSANFSQVMGETIKQYYTRRRFERAVELLEEGVEIVAVAEKIGFKTVHAFSRAFRNFYGCPPGEYRKRLLER